MSADFGMGPRPRWPDWVVVVSLVILAGIGVGAIWGQEIRGWLGDLADDKGSQKPPSGPGEGGRRL